MEKTHKGVRSPTNWLYYFPMGLIHLVFGLQESELTMDTCFACITLD